MNIRENLLLDSLVPTVQAEPARGYAGNVSPEHAWELFRSGAAVLVDVRTAAELAWVGYVPGAEHVEWISWPSYEQNPRFIEELEAIADRDQIVLLLCRSGQRSARAAELATAAGFAQAYNVRDGFEGQLDETGRRGRRSGWRHAGLPWEQE